jgi:hypothetical protein
VSALWRQTAALLFGNWRTRIYFLQNSPRPCSYFCLLKEPHIRRSRRSTFLKKARQYKCSGVYLCMLIQVAFGIGKRNWIDARCGRGERILLRSLSCWAGAPLASFEVVESPYRRRRTRIRILFPARAAEGLKLLRGPQPARVPCRTAQASSRLAAWTAGGASFLSARAL